MTSKPRAWRPDLWMCAALVTLIGFGVVALYSSSSVVAARRFDHDTFFLVRRGVWLLLGLLALGSALMVPRAWLRRRSGWWFGAAVALCALVLVPGVGRVAGGARRWLDIGAWSLQPSELCKLAVVVFLAALLAHREQAREDQRLGFLWLLVLTQIPVLLVLAEPDLGTAMVLEAVAVLMIFAAGLPWRALILVGLAALPVLYHVVVATPFRLRRLVSYIDPWAYRSSTGYQVTEALISIGSGGLWGVGLGQSKHKLFFLPEAHTDFIFAILAEEVGFVGVVILVSAYAVLLWRGFRLAIRAPAAFERYLALGLTLSLAVPVVFNLGVVTGLLPTKGLPLPLLSKGGSNLVVTLLAIGLLFRIDRGCWHRQDEATRQRRPA